MQIEKCVTVQSPMKVAAQTRACVARAELYLPVLSARSNGTGRNCSARATHMPLLLPVFSWGTERLPFFNFVCCLGMLGIWAVSFAVYAGEVPSDADEFLREVRSSMGEAAYRKFILDLIGKQDAKPDVRLAALQAAHEFQSDPKQGEEIAVASATAFADPRTPNILLSAVLDLLVQDRRFDPGSLGQLAQSMRATGAATGPVARRLAEAKAAVAEQALAGCVMRGIVAPPAPELKIASWCDADSLMGSVLQSAAEDWMNIRDGVKTLNPAAADDEF